MSSSSSARKGSPYDRLNSLRKRVDSLSSSKSGSSILQKSRKELLSSSSASSSSAPVSSNSVSLPAPSTSTTINPSMIVPPSIPQSSIPAGLERAIAAASYHNVAPINNNNNNNDQSASAEITAPAEALPLPENMLGYTNAERSIRHMNQYFDYNSYVAQAPDHPNRNAAPSKLTKKQIQILKKRKIEKKKQKKLEWLYND